MVKTLSLKLPQKGKFFVRVGERIEKGSVLVEGEKEGERQTLSLTKIFKIPPNRIFKFLVKKLGDKVRQGEILAKKEGLFGRVMLKSPIEGKVVEVSCVSGEITLAGKEKKAIVKSPVSGKVKEISKGQIKIEFAGFVLGGKRSGGERAFGVIENLPADVGVLDLSNKVGQKILVCQNFSPALLAKAWALEAAGVVSLNFPPKDPFLPFLTVDEKDFEELKNYQGKRAILDPKDRRLIVLLD